MPDNLEIIGIHEGHNSSVARVLDGRLCFAIQEERLTRVKNQGGLPVQSLAMQGKGGEIAWAGTNLFRYVWEREDVLRAYDQEGFSIKGALWGGLRKWQPVSEYVNKRRIESTVGAIGKAQDRKKPKIYRWDHHLSHAASAYYGWGRMSDPVLVLTCDGAGDHLCATVNVGRNGELQRIAGRLYSMVTRNMGMVPLEHEYKIMGLAPYGAGTPQARALTAGFHDWFRLDQKTGMTWTLARGSAIQKMGSQLRDELRNVRFDHAAAGLQTFVEEFLTDWVRNCIRETGVKKVALSGGVFMNVKLNQKILELEEVDELFIFPSCGDETNSIGAAWLLHSELSGEPPDPLGHFYLGDQFAEDEIGKEVEGFQFQNTVEIRQCDVIEDEVGALLAEGGVVARFSGRMEFGARALGNRSILANPATPHVIPFINDAIKQRDFWMPFAGSVLAERSGDYYDNPKEMEAPYMIITFNTLAAARKSIRGAIHPKDHTTRPQQVYEKWNSSFYRILKSFEDRTGEAFVLNTSFNLHGEPLVRSPWDALDVFDRSGLPALAVGNYMIKKTGDAFHHAG